MKKEFDHPEGRSGNHPQQLHTTPSRFRTNDTIKAHAGKQATMHPRLWPREHCEEEWRYDREV
jgi:hypothetical protein